MNTFPIDTVLPRLTDALRDHASVVLHAPPGAGKTTRVPLELLDILPPDKGRIIMLEPRRIAAVSAARWMAKTLDEPVGDTIGYTIRFDSKKSEKTRVEIVTEGVLTRRLQSDPGLEGVSLVIFDEFHERSIHADLALALCLDVRKHLRDDLKILVMSATLDCGPIASLLGNAPIVASTGKAFPVEERYQAENAGPLPARIAGAVKTALRETHGDILVFLPGSGEIRSAVTMLRESLNEDEERIALHPLYGDLPFEEQERAIVPSKDYRKIVLATNIAETSLTIEGVRVVIDSGLARLLRYDSSTGMNRLMTATVSRASAEQRKGRAGRLGPGMCYRLYTKQDLHGMMPFTRPEILISDLSPLALELAAWGVKDPLTLSWLDAPSAAAWESGRQLLNVLGAIDRAGSITSIGRSMARLPLHPRLSRLMVRAHELGRPRLGADLAALLSERDIIRRASSDNLMKEPDVSERIELFRRWRSGDRENEAVDQAAARSVDRTSKQLLRLLRERPGTNEDDLGSGNADAISRLLLSAYPDRICKRREEGGSRFVLAQGRGVRIPRESRLSNSLYLIAVNVDAGEQSEGFVHMAEPVSEEMIRGECAPSIETVRRIEWDPREGRITAAVEERIETLLISQKTFTPSDEESSPILCSAIRADRGLLAMSSEARQFQAKVALLRRAFPEETWPDLSDERLFSEPGEWLPAWLGGIRSAHGLHRLDVLPALKARLSWDQQRLLDERMPDTLVVPSGSRIKLDYSSGTAQPVLAVKLQEMFGLADTPVIGNGRVPVLLHLLSPARRPVQITRDLKGFWNTGYQLVKKDLKGRYPKHPWPDDPWNAPPTRRAKPRGE